MSKCDVCGQEAETVVACSSCGAVSFAYCQECLNGGREPYDALVGMGLPYDCLNKTYRERIILPSLKFFGKTIEEFNADVEKMDEDFAEWVKNNESNSD